jgi:hypothetical protein
MLKDYFEETKERFDKVIPEYGTGDFKKMKEDIRKGLQKEDSQYILLRKTLKTLILGDWYNPEKKKILTDIKNSLLKNGYYAQTIDAYRTPATTGGLDQKGVLEYCCVQHQLLVFIDGDGPGTLTEQNYLTDNYLFHGKTIFFIERSKFDKLKINPSEYFMNFPTIIPYTKEELIDDVLTYVALRINRLAHIIMKQSRLGRGLSSNGYRPWSKRLGWQKA